MATGVIEIEGPYGQTWKYGISRQLNLKRPNWSAPGILEATIPAN
jgi:hypothetical protein